MYCEKFLCVVYCQMKITTKYQMQVQVSRHRYNQAKVHVDRADQWLRRTFALRMCVYMSHIYSKFPTWCISRYQNAFHAFLLEMFHTSKSDLSMRRQTKRFSHCREFEKEVSRHGITDR